MQPPPAMTCDVRAALLGGFPAIVKLCHADEYRTIQIVITVVTAVLLLAALGNLAALLAAVGWRNINKNNRVLVHVVNSTLTAVGLVCYLFYCQNLWLFRPGWRQWLGSLGLFFSQFIVYTIFLITLLHWYDIMMALQASVSRRHYTKDRVSTMAKCLFPPWLLFGLGALTVTIVSSAIQTTSVIKARSKIYRCCALIMVLLIFLVTVFLSVRIIRLFRQIKRERQRATETMERALTENDLVLDHHANVISSMSVLFGFILFLNTIEASIMLYYSLRVNIYPNWDSVKWRLLVDTVTNLALYTVLLLTHRYNRDSPRASELWNNVLGSVRNKFTIGSVINTQVDTTKDGGVTIADPADFNGMATSKKSFRDNDAVANV